MRLLAEHPGIGRMVELRMLSPRAPVEGLGRMLLEREARAHGAAASPHIQSVLDSGVDGGRPYVALEAIVGPTVTELVAAGPLAVDEAARLVLQVLDAMRALHRHRAVIRALSPGDVVVVERRGERTVKLRGLDRVEFLDGEPSGLAVPFSPYVAPEIRRGADGRDVRVDVYSAGALFRHLVTGRPQGGAVTDELAARAIARAMADDPDERFPSAEVCMQAIAVCAAEDDGYGATVRASLDPLLRDLHYLTLRRRTRHGTLAEDRGSASVELGFALLTIEAIYRLWKDAAWSRLVDDVPEVESLLPSAGQTARYEFAGVPVELFERVLETVDRVCGRGDLASLPEIAEAMLEKGPQRLFPDLPESPSIDAIVDGFPFLWVRLRRRGRASVQAREERRAKLVVQRQHGPSLEVSALVAALIRALVRSSVGPRGDVSVLGCAALGDEGDVFEVRW